MKMYIISSVYYNYDDQYHFSGEGLAANISCFIDKELAEENLKKLENEAIVEYISSHDSYEFEDPINMSEISDKDFEFIAKKVKYKFKKSDYVSADVIGYCRGFFKNSKYEDMTKDEKKIIDILLPHFNNTFYTITEAEVCDTFA